MDKIGWTEEQIEALKKLIRTPASYSEMARELNLQFGTSYSRNACIGKAMRIRLSHPMKPTRSPRIVSIDRNRLQSKERREKRWAANPALAVHYQRRAEKKSICKKMLNSGATKTSACYRKHLPKLGEMTRNQLRAMLTTAVQNTAALESVA